MLTWLCIAAFGASLLTFFSGFGLGTILLPVFAMFFPIPQAILLTAIVHLLNNLFKISLVGHHTKIRVVLQFGIPACLFAIMGAQVLAQISFPTYLWQYTFQNQTYEVELLKLIIALLMIVFTILELLPLSEKIRIKPNLLWMGGALSGFFGGLSGHQGALRSMFLIRMNLSKEAFIACGVAIALIIDISRISIYITDEFWLHWNAQRFPLFIATISALAGSLAGKLLLPKFKLGFVTFFVSVAILIFSVALGAGWV